MQNENTTNQGSSARGFAVMDEDKQREIASKGGRAAHRKGTAHEFTSEEAAAAGRKGGRARHANRDIPQGSQRETPQALRETEIELEDNESPIL